MQILVNHVGIGEYVRANPSLTALAVSEFYHIAYTKYKEAVQQRANGSLVDTVYAYNVLSANFETWLVELETFQCLNLAPCTCYGQQSTCSGCNDNATMENEFLEMCLSLLENFRYDPVVIDLVLSCDHWGAALVDGESIMVYPANQPYTTTQEEFRPTPVFRPFAAIQSAKEGSMARKERHYASPPKVGRGMSQPIFCVDDPGYLPNITVSPPPFFRKIN